MTSPDPLASSATRQSPFGASFERLQAVDSVIALVSDMAGLSKPSALVLDQPTALESAYQNSLVVIRHRFDRGCDDLAAIAQSGTRALLQLHAQGRKDTSVAAARLMREIDRSARETLALLDS